VLFVKRIIGALLEPFSLAFVLAGVGAVALLRGRRGAATYLFVCAAVLAYVASLPIVGNALLAPLEQRYAAFDDDDPAPPVDFIVVLGSSYQPRDDAPVTAELDREALVRIVEGIRLRAKLPDATLIVSGGAPRGSFPTAHGYAALARQLGIEDDAIVVIDTPLDTTAEARAVVARIGSAPFVLVTSAYHMPRAMRRMQQAGAQAIPGPTGHLAPQEASFEWLDLVPTSRGIDKTDRALHEYLGLLALRLGID